MIEQFPTYLENLNSIKNNIKNENRFFDLYDIDITSCKWKDIFNECFSDYYEVSKPDLIQFNFPWYYRSKNHIGTSNTTSEIFDSFIKFSQENLASNGYLKLGIVDYDSQYYSYYGDEIDKLIYGTNNIFELIEHNNFCQKYPEYTHVSSDSLKNLHWHIQEHGIEITFKLKPQEDK